VAVSVAVLRTRAATRSLVAALALALGAVALVAPALPARADSGGTLVALLNGARASAGLPALSVSGDLSAAATAQAQRMAATHTLSHTPNLPGAVCCWLHLGENVGAGPSAAAIHSAFMASSEHRANILGAQYNQVGVGVVADSAGQLWVSEIFRQSTSTTSNPGGGSGSGGGAKPSPPATRRPTARPTTRPAVKPSLRPATPHAGTPRAPTTPAKSVTPSAIPTPASAGLGIGDGAASRGLSEGRLPLDAASRYAAQVDGLPTVQGPDPVSRVLDFVVLTAALPS